MPEQPPDKPHEWTSDDYKRIEAWLLERWGPGRKCPMCGTFDWSIANTPTLLPVGGRDGTVYLGQSFPTVVIVCNHCGNMVLINAILAQIVSAAELEGGNG